MVSLRDIANATGYSLSTVSIVLRGIGKERGIPESTQEKVLEVAKAMDYQPNVSARRLRSDVPLKRGIAVFWADDFRVVMVAKFLQGVQQYIKEHAANLEVVICPYEPGHLFTAATIPVLNMYAGAIICTASKEDMAYVDSLDVNSPIVVYNRESEKYPCVGVDNEEIGVIAARKLLSDGCKNMLFISDNSDHFYLASRCSGFIKECERANMSVETIFVNNNTIQMGKDCGARLEVGTEKTGVFIVSDYIAMGLLCGLVDRGVKIPEQVEVISTGTSDIDIYQCLRPSLSIVEVPLEKMAYQCARMLHAIINHEVLSERGVNVPFRLCLGNSTLG